MFRAEHAEGWFKGLPIHKDFHSMLDGMTEQYCTGDSEETSRTESAEGYPNKTCRKALQVFYAACKEKGLDYTKPMPVHEHVTAILPFNVLERIVDKPLRIKGVAMTAGMSRNFNIYTPEELQAFAQKLVSAPVYIEHVAVPNAVGKVTKAWWDPQSQSVCYEAEIYDDETAEKIRKGLIQHVSVGADYERIDVLDGKVPHGLHNAELSLVAVPGIPETSIQVLEKLQQGKAKASESLPLKAAALVDDFRLDGREYITPGEYILGFHRDPYAFMPEHFSTVWLDRENGVLALIGRLRQEPEKRRIQAILFQREKWDEPKIRDWFLLHPHYLIESASAPTGSPPQAQEPLNEHGGKMQQQKTGGSNPLQKTEKIGEKVTEKIGGEINILDLRKLTPLEKRRLYDAVVLELKRRGVPVE